jgi:hypothetical protein
MLLPIQLLLESQRNSLNTGIKKRALIEKVKNKIKHVFKTIECNLRIFRYNQIDRRHQYKILESKIANPVLDFDLYAFNSTNNRFVEANDKDNDLKTVVVTCYFTLKPDPQTGSIRNAADFKYIQPWYDSLLKLGCHGIILHDGLEKTFIDQYQTTQIQFRYCEMGNYSIFEERWLLYHLFLQQLPLIEKIFFTDSNDVYITKNPFSFITKKSALYVGRDNANRIKDSGWLEAERLKFLKESNYNLAKTYEYQWVYNAGVCGGSRALMFFVTNEISKLIFLTTSNCHKDMTLLNIVIHNHFYPKLSFINWSQNHVDPIKDEFSSHDILISGYPFNSGFKDFDYQSKAYFIHK